MRRARGPVLALLAAAALSGCAERTYVVVAVSGDPALQPAAAQSRVVGRLMLGGVALAESDGVYPDPAGSAALAFPSSYIVVADGRGRDGESLAVLVELRDAAAATVGRARGEVAIQPGRQSTLEVLVRAPCSVVDDCLVGGTFCARPQRCVCESAGSCAEGVCEPLVVDDSNDCTADGCDEGSRTTTHVIVADGTACQPLGGGATPLRCVGGLCACGDGVTNPVSEECDEGAANADEPNRCRVSPPCTLPRCGDGIVDDRAPFGEECDEGAGNSNAPDATCRVDCRLPRCGDGIVDALAGEECDDGDDCSTGRCNDDQKPLACRTTCQKPSCGDGVTDSGWAFGEVHEEECDDGPGNSNSVPDACRQEVTYVKGGTPTGPAWATVRCKRAFCGDGVQDAGERCDDADLRNGDGCNPTCSLLGEVSLIAGAPGGLGRIDGVGAGARLHDPFGVVAVGGFAYFTESEDHSDSSEPHAIRRLDLTTNEVNTIAGRLGHPGLVDGAPTEARFSQPRGLAEADGQLFVADMANHAVRRVVLATGAVSTVAGTGMRGDGDGPTTAATLAAPAFIAARTTTELYVMTTELGCMIRKIDLQAGQVTTVAGNSMCYGSQADGFGTAARFGEPRGMLVDAAGNALYVADRYKIRKVDLTQNPVQVSTVAGGSLAGWANATGTSAQFRMLGGLAVEGTALWIADQGNHEIRKLDLSSLAVTTEFGDHGQPGASDAPARFNEPRALALQPGRVLVGEYASHVLRGVDRVGGTAATLAGTRSQAGSADGGLLAARFSAPRAIALHGQDVYVGSPTQRLRRLDLAGATVGTLSQAPDPMVLGLYEPVAAPDGRLFAVFQNQDLYQLDPVTGAPTGLTAGGPIDLVEFGVPHGGVVLGDDLYVVDPSESLLYRVRLDTGAVSVFAGRSQSLSASDGPLAEALFVSPVAITACNGELFIAENDSLKQVAGHVIRRIDLASQWVSTVAGSPDLRGDRDGQGVAVRFNSPEGIACDGRSLYVADTLNHVVRQIGLATGEVTTFVGLSGEAGAVDGTGSAARLNYPRGLVHDPAAGCLYVADRDDNVLRRIR
ncbi:MAG: hypothetical protein HY906_21330 [Deltaproteobacteria bacterium]|nr:hypothetical protein [Deltaproteobacteria bacterium]